MSNLVDSIRQDLVNAARILRRAPGFSAISIAVLALAIGGNTAIFSVVNALLLRDLPVHAPRDLAFVHTASSASPMVATYDDAMSWAARTDLFSGVATMNGAAASIGSGADAAQVSGEAVSPNYFDVLGVKVAHGRGLTAALVAPADAAPAVVISDRLWRRQFNADTSILGKTVRLQNGGRADAGWRYVIVGVTAPTFLGIADPWNPTDFWVPALQRDRESRLGLMFSDWAPRVGWVVVRRQPGVALSQVQALADVMRQRELLANPSRAAVMNGRVVAGASRPVKLPLDPSGKIAVDRLAVTVLAVGFFVLAIGIANLMGVMIARAIVRAPEIAVRLSLGASRGQLARGLLAESLLLSVIAGAVGILLSRPLVASFLASLPAGFGSQGFEAPLDVQVLLFATGVAIVAGIVVGIAPLRQAARTDLLATLGSASENSPRHARSRLRRWIVIPQISLSVALLLTAGIAVKSLLAVAMLEPGYQPDQTAYVSFSVLRTFAAAVTSTREERQRESDRQSEQLRRSVSRMIEYASTLTGVSDVAVATSTPIGQSEVHVVIREGYTPEATHYATQTASVSPEYFQTLGVPIRAGRDFDARDSAAAPAVAVVDETLAARLWPGQNPIGRSLAMHGPGSTNQPYWMEVVGVAGGVRHPLSEGDVRPFLYLPLDQQEQSSRIRSASLMLIARGSGNGELIRTLRTAVAHADPDLAMDAGKTLNEAIGRLRYPRRIGTALLGSSSLIALALAMMGLYGVVAFSVAQRTRELGIRAALGATRGDLVRFVMREGLGVAGVGAVLGVLLSFAGIKIVSNNVFAIPALDAAVIGAVSVLLVAIVLLGCYLPARRAARVNPMRALRNV